MGLSPKKHLGQHFLKDLHYARRIVDCVPQGSDQAVIEIGPGEGVLTGMLIEKYGKLTAVEVDPDAVDFLCQRFTEEQLSIVFSDVLKWNPQRSLDAPGHIVGNLPYNISSPIFFHLLEHKDLIASGTFMLQKEVAERICASPGSKTFGILSVLVGAYFDCTYEFTVPPGAFRPPPKVHSGVMTMKPSTRAVEVEFSHLKSVVKKAFNQRRKTLKNAMKGMEITTIPADDPRWKLRAEQLQISDFVEIAGGTLS